MAWRAKAREEKYGDEVCGVLGLAPEMGTLVVEVVIFELKRSHKTREMV